MKDEEVIKLFIEACEINSPSGYERPMANWLTKKLTEAGFSVWEDKTGLRNSCNSGNVYACFEVDKAFPTVVFSAHMDTVANIGDCVNPKYFKGVFRSDGNTILGADNRSGIVSILCAVTSLITCEIENNIMLFFPTREEKGVMGSKYFNPGRKVKYIFNIDESAQPGNFVTGSLGYQNFEIVVKGKSAHAAKEYEKGRNALVAAADLVNNLPLGRSQVQGRTLNLGVISGGHNTNSVCDFVSLKGEHRGFSVKQMKISEVEIKDICQRVSRKHNVKVSYISDKVSYISPFDVSKGKEIVRICSDAAKRCNLKPVFNKSFSTSDANSFSGLGYSVISVARGGKNPHSYNESIDLKELKSTIELIKELIYLS